MSVFRIIKFVHLFGMAALTLAGCGGGGGGSNSNEATQDNNNPNLVTIGGSVEKGPYIIGSSITVGRLDENGEATDSTLTTQTTNDLGDFNFSYEEGAFLQVIANGYYRNEITGELSAGTLSLRSIYVVSSNEQQSAHVNILTHLASNRVLELVSQGSSPSDAISSAENELIDLFDAIIPSPFITSFASLSIYESSVNQEDSAYLTLISSLFYQHSLILADINSTNPDAELSLVLNDLANDFSDGNVEDISILNDLRQAMLQINPVSVQLHLNEFADLANSPATPANINLFLDSDLDGQANEYDPDDDNDNVLDGDDNTPYEQNFIVSDLNLQTDEDTDLSVVLTSNSPSNGSISYTVIEPPQNGVLTGDFPTLVYHPNLDFNGIEIIQLYLSQGSITSEPVRIVISVLSGNDEPVIGGNPETKINAYENYSFVPLTNDVDGDELQFTITNKPNWLVFSSATGELSGTPTNDNAGTYPNIIISTSDGVNEASLASFTIEVEASPWIPLKDMPEETRGGAVAIYNGILYYFGGTASEWRSVQAYDPLTNIWSARSPMPVGIHDLSAHTIGDKIYVISGYGDDGFVNDTLEYDPSNDSWETKTPRPTHRYIFSSAEVNGLIYVIGGHGTVDDGPWRSGVSWNYKSYVEIYNPQTDSWSNGQAAPIPLASNASCVLNEKIYVIGGSAGNGSSSAVHVYDPNLDSWLLSQSMLSAKEALSCAVIDQTLFVFGGRDSNGALNSAESFSLMSGVWSSESAMTSPRYWFPVAVYEGKAYIFGGRNDSASVKSLEMYDPSFDQ